METIAKYASEIWSFVGGLSKVEVNELVRDSIVVPTVQECGSSVFVINHSTAMGMVYWLADQCFVRWHP